MRMILSLNDVGKWDLLRCRMTKKLFREFLIWNNMHVCVIMGYWKILYQCFLFSCHSLYCCAFSLAHQWIKRREWRWRMKRGNDDDDDDNDNINNKANRLAKKIYTGYRIEFPWDSKSHFNGWKAFYTFSNVILCVFIVYCDNFFVRYCWPNHMLVSTVCFMEIVMLTPE